MKNQSVKKSAFPHEMLSNVMHNAIWIFSLVFVLLFSNTVLAQNNVGVNTITPDASAMLDVVSTQSGVLVPRMTMAQRDVIVLPATSLLIYQNDNTPGFYYNSGTADIPAWIMIGGEATGEWTDEGAYLHPNENVNARVFEDNNSLGFYYSGLAETPGYFRSTETGVDNTGVVGICNVSDYFGWGGLFGGGYCGVQGTVLPTGAEEYNGVIGTVDGGTGSNYGVYGNAINGANNYGVTGLTSGVGVNVGVYGNASGGTNNIGIYGIVDDTDGLGVYAANEDASGTAIFGTGNGIAGSSLVSGSGVAGSSTNAGIYGYGDATAGSYGVYGTSVATDGVGTLGISSNIGVYGSGDATAASKGIYAKSEAADGIGIFSIANNVTSYTAANGAGGVFNGNDGAHAYGNIATGNGLIAVGNDDLTIHVLTEGTGVAASSTVAGVYGFGDATGTAPKGVYGQSDADDGIGVFGINEAISSNTYGVYGQVGDGTDQMIDPVAVMGYNREQNDNCGYGGYFSAEYAGIYSENRTTTLGYAGYFSGNIEATGTIGAAIKLFVIDNPENPENEILRHTSIESPEAMVIYRGKVKLNATGKANVEMPSYFKALTMENEATVQITCIGQPFEIGYEWNPGFTSFVVYGDANREISWMVMADRDDPYIQQNRKPVVTLKDNSDKGYKSGYYIHPELYGQPQEKSYNYLWHKKDRKFPTANETTEIKKIKSNSNQNPKLKTASTFRSIQKPEIKTIK
jgi:hypothetical protein